MQKAGKVFKLVHHGSLNIAGIVYIYSSKKETHSSFYTILFYFNEIAVSINVHDLNVIM
jgi:hypothetical protein